MSHGQLIIQNRVFAKSPEDAIEQIRQRHGVGEIWLRLVFDGMDWYEYRIRLAGD